MRREGERRRVCSGMVLSNGRVFLPVDKKNMNKAPTAEIRTVLHGATGSFIPTGAKMLTAPRGSGAML